MTSPVVPFGNLAMVFPPGVWRKFMLTDAVTTTSSPILNFVDGGGWLSRERYWAAAQPLPKLVESWYQTRLLALLGPPMIEPLVPDGIVAITLDPVPGALRR